MDTQAVRAYLLDLQDRITTAVGAFDGGTFDLANGIFVPNAEYAEYGATN